MKQFVIISCLAIIGFLVALTRYYDGISSNYLVTALPSGQIVFSAIGEETNNDNLYMYNLSTHTYNQLTYGDKGDVFPEFAPDGKSIVFASGDDGKKNLFSLDIESLKITQITFTEQTSNSKPKWSPDGNFLAYVVSDSNIGTQIHLMEMATGQTEILVTKESYPGDFDWDINSKKLLFASYKDTSSIQYKDLYSIDIVTKQIQRITYPSSGTKHFDSISVSFDGRLIAYTGSHSPNTIRFYDTVFGEVRILDIIFLMNMPNNFHSIDYELLKDYEWYSPHWASEQFMVFTLKNNDKRSIGIYDRFNNNVKSIAIEGLKISTPNMWIESLPK